MNDQNIQYLELIVDMEFREHAGRYTILQKKARGFLLDEGKIKTLYNASEEAKKSMLERLKSSKAEGRCFALVAGYPVVLDEYDYRRLETTPHYCCGQLI